MGRDDSPCLGRSCHPARLSARTALAQEPLCALPVLLLFLVLGIIRLQAMLALPPTDIAAFAGTEVKLSGTVVDEPRWTPSVLPDGSRIYKVRYLVAVEQLKQPRADWQKASGKCYLYARAKALPEQPARIGDAVQASGKVRLPRGYQNPGQLDTNLLLRADGITAGVVAGKSGVKVELRDGHEFRRFIAAVRAHYREGMERAMPKEDAAAVFAMLFGGYEAWRTNSSRISRRRASCTSCPSRARTSA